MKLKSFVVRRSIVAVTPGEGAAAVTFYKVFYFAQIWTKTGNILFLVREI